MQVSERTEKLQFIADHLQFGDLVRVSRITGLSLSYVRKVLVDRVRRSDKIINVTYRMIKNDLELKAKYHKRRKSNNGNQNLPISAQA